MNNRDVIMQYYEWYTKPEDNLWQKVASEAEHLASIGITSVWLPPAYKGAGGIYDVGYGCYDLYDLGEFEQKGTIRTKYGTKREYLEAVRILKENNIKVLADVVFNQKMGGDQEEEVIATEDDPYNRNNRIGEPRKIKAWTKFNFPGRHDKYSTFKWNWTHFTGTDWDEIEQRNGIFKFYGKNWDLDVDKENGNFDYLMGCDVDMNNVDVVTELINWAEWYINETHIDGFRIDAAKHIRTSFFERWLKELRRETGKELFTVGEYWSANVGTLLDYLRLGKEDMSLFDVPLHYSFFNASNSNGKFDMRTILDGSLTSINPHKSVMFVDNHDTEPGQSLESYVQPWFKPLAYALILLRNEGIPCVFYGDYYGIPEKGIEGQKDIIEKLLKVRKEFAYGNLRDHFDAANIIGWTRDGDYDHQNSGMAVVMSDGPGGAKMMNVGTRLANSYMYDYLGNVEEPVYVDQDGNGIFYCNSGSVSVWVRKTN